MFFYLSKIVWFFATPSNLLVSLVLGGLLVALTRRGRRIGLGVAALAALGILVVGLSPLSSALILPLETRFPPYRDDGTPVAGIVVLGGGLQADETVRRGQIALNEAGERVVAVLDLARKYPEARIVLSGGGGSMLLEDPPEADATADFLVRLGVARERIVLENRSRTTAENATFTAALLAPRPGERWLLVTSAWHMPRAVGVFRRAGLDVTAYPVDYRTNGLDDLSRVFGFVSDGLRRTDIVTKEWAGLLAYYLAGRTSEAFPAP